MLWMVRYKQGKAKVETMSIAANDIDEAIYRFRIARPKTEIQAVFTGSCRAAKYTDGFALAKFADELLYLRNTKGYTLHKAAKYLLHLNMFKAFPREMEPFSCLRVLRRAGLIGPERYNKAKQERAR